MSYSMSDLLQLVVSEGASDLHIRVGAPPVIRVHGILHRVEGPALQSSLRQRPAATLFRLSPMQSAGDLERRCHKAIT